jgi:hypothetical protein
MATQDSENADLGATNGSCQSGCRKNKSSAVREKHDGNTIRAIFSSINFEKRIGGTLWVWGGGGGGAGGRPAGPADGGEA